MMDRNRYLLIFFILLFQVCTDVYSSEGDTGRVTLVFAGDVMGHDSQIISAWQEKQNIHDYHPCFEYVGPFIRQADIAIANLEVTLGGPPYSGYPQFSSPDALAGALKDAGFDMLLNANNHTLDRGKQGLLRTIRTMKQHDFIHTGVFPDQETRDSLYPLLIEKNGILIGILNFTYGTNGLKTDTPVIVNYIDTAQIRTDLEKVRKAGPDFIIALAHWGNEYERIQNSTQERLASFMFQHGVHAIIGSHPHVIQPVVISPDPADTSCIRMVVYSLGNFLSNQRDRYRDGGIMFFLELTKTDRTRITDYSYLPVWVSKPVENGTEVFRLVPAGNREKKEPFPYTVSDPEKLTLFRQDTRLQLGNIPEEEKDF
jgi:poly-gamma-glutamate synthesis protein (capsule biosynthesis protein)